MSLLIQGLKQYEAVVVGESIILQLADNSYLSHRNYLVDGEPREINNTQVVLNKGAVIQKVIKGTSKIIGLTLLDGSYVDYHTYIKQGNMYEDEDGNPNYPSLEEEYQHKKLMQKYQGSQWVYETTPETYEDIDINIVGEVADTGCIYIENALAFGQGKFNNSGFYRVNMKGVIANAVGKFSKETGLELHQSSDNIEYVQLGGSYVFNSSFKYNNVFKSSQYRVVTTLQAAKEVVYEVENDTWKYLSLKYGTNLKVCSDSASVIHAKITGIQSRVNVLEVKTKSDGTLRLLKKEIIELQEALYSIIKGETK